MAKAEWNHDQPHLAESALGIRGGKILFKIAGLPIAWEITVAEASQMIAAFTEAILKIEARDGK